MGYHHHHHKPGKKNYIFYAVAFTVLFGIIEAICGWWSGSLTLLSDAGHMAIDALALSLAALAVWFRSRPATTKHTYGFGRIEVIVSWISGLLLIALTISIFLEAIKRFQTPLVVASKTVIIVAIIGLLLNALIAWILSKGEKTLNTTAALLHVLSDLLGSIAVLVSGIVIYFTNWMLIDPLLSMFVCILILIATIRLLRESLLILMEGVPTHIEVSQVAAIICATSGVHTVHDLHIWTLTSGTTLLTAHVVVNEPTLWPNIIDNLRVVIEKNFGITHTTLQIETTIQAPYCINCNNHS